MRQIFTNIDRKAPSALPLAVDVAARTSISNLEEAVTAALPQNVKALMVQTQSRQKQYRNSILAGMLFCVFGTGLLVAATSRLSPMASLWLITAMLCVCIGLMFRMARNWTAGGKALAALNDVQTVPALVEMLGAPGAKNQMVAQTALITLLPRLTGAHANLLNETQRMFLRRILGGIVLTPAKERITLAKSILGAYEYIGDRNDLLTVERLATQKGFLSADRTVRETALKCLPGLRRRIDNANDEATLLRGARGETAGADVLVRPAHGGVENRSDELLRGGSADGS